eukprot:2964792-Pyramimonas_sp.AAC.1
MVRGFARGSSNVVGPWLLSVIIPLIAVAGCVVRVVCCRRRSCRGGGRRRRRRARAGVVRCVSAALP